MQRISDIKLSPDSDISELKKLAAGMSNINVKDIKTFNIVKKSIDARKKNDIKIIYTADISDTVEPPEPVIFDNANKIPKNPPVIVGSGPSGLFCAYLLAKAGLNPIIFERGSEVGIRKQKVDAFISGGELDENTNVQFGEGGAGTFSDGKLTTQISSPYKDTVLKLFVEAGAPEEILYLNKPHIGTDRLIDVVKNMRESIEKSGGKFYFDTKVEDVINENSKVSGVIANSVFYPSETVIFAIGHSARDTYEMLYKKGIQMEQKEFSCGFRIEHPQSLINISQYGEKYAENKNLGSADYKLVSHTKNEHSIYTFCMCPGGKVIAAASEKGHLVTNGMSLYNRDGKNANSALLCNIKPSDFPNNSPLAGIAFQRELEKKAFLLGGGNYFAPVQTVADFFKGVIRNTGRVLPSYLPGITPAPLHTFFNKKITDSFRYAIDDMTKYISCFNLPQAVLTAVETRSSSPVRITRDAMQMSVNTSGLYPIGEGAGYAGGIMSSAIDGIKTAKTLLQTIYN